MTDSVQTVEYGTVLFDGVPFPVDGPVGYRNLARFEDRIVYGDPSLDDDPLLSSRVYSDFSGGCGIYNEKEGADTGRFWDALGVNIDHPGQIILGPLVQSFTGSAANDAFILGVYNDTVYLSMDKNIYSFSESTDTITDTTFDFPFNPRNKGVNFKGTLYVPMLGPNIYYTFAGGAPVAGVAGITAIAFALWDNKLCCIESDGQLSYTTDGATWASPAGAIIQSGETPSDIVTFFTRGDETSLYVITNAGVYGYDPVSEVLISTSVQYPITTNFGTSGIPSESGCVWRSGENMYIGVAQGVYEWSGPGGTISPIGLDRDEGVPYLYHGRIRSLASTLNHIYIVMEALDTTSGYNSVYRYNGSGWVRMWEAAAGLLVNVHWAMVTNADNVYRVWWGIGDHVYSMELQKSFLSPRELVAQGTASYASAGYIETSWFDADFPSVDKLLSHFFESVYIKSGTTNVHINISMATDHDDTTLAALGTVDADGRFFHDIDQSCESVKFLFDFVRTTATTTPVLNNGVLKYLKVPTSYDTFDINIPLEFEGLWVPGSGGLARDAHTVASALKTLLLKRTMITMSHGQNTYRGRLSSVGGYDHTGKDRRGGRTVTFVEVPFSGEDSGFAEAGA